MTASDRIWTRSPAGGWCTRDWTAGDLARHGILRRWLSEEITFKKAADEIRARGLTEFECAP